MEEIKKMLGSIETQGINDRFAFDAWEESKHPRADNGRFVRITGSVEENHNSRTTESDRNKEMLDFNEKHGESRMKEMPVDGGYGKVWSYEDGANWIEITTRNEDIVEFIDEKTGLPVKTMVATWRTEYWNTDDSNSKFYYNLIDSPLDEYDSYKKRYANLETENRTLKDDIYKQNREIAEIKHETDFMQHELINKDKEIERLRMEIKEWKDAYEQKGL